MLQQWRSKIFGGLIHGLFLLPAVLQAQVGGYDRKMPDVFSVNAAYGQNGWYLTPGLTHTVGISASERANLGVDSLRIQRELPTGRLGAFLQFGRFHAIDSKWITAIDYGLDVRWLRGLHRRETEVRLGTENPNWITSSGNGHFSDLWVGLTGNATFARHVTSSVFIWHSLGVNLNYAVIRESVFVGDYSNTVDFVPPAFKVQLHYKLGFGFRVGRGWYVMPCIETPILGIYDWNGAIPSLLYFDTYYQPLLFGIQIMRRDRAKPEGCPPEGPTGKDRKRNTNLWDSKMNKKYNW